MPNITFSLIFVNYQSAPLLAKSLASLDPVREDVASEIIIINNDQRESKVIDEVGKKYGAIVRHLPENKGFGKANNMGAEIAEGEIVIFLNPDTSFQGGKIESLKAALDFQPKAILGLRLIDDDGKEEPWSCGRAPRLSTLLLRRIFPWRLFSQPWQARRAEEVDWVSGAALAMKKDLFDDVGGFDERYFLYYEDVDLCLRARKKGAIVLSYPFFRFQHLRGQSHTSHHSMKERYFEGQRKYFDDHGSWTEKMLYPLIQPLYRFFSGI